MLKMYYLSTFMLASALMGLEVNAVEEESQSFYPVPSIACKQPKDHQPIQHSPIEPTAEKVHLDIANCSNPVEILEILHIYRTVTSLNLTYSMFTDQIACLLPEYCKILTTLKAGFTELTDLGVEVIAEHYPELIYLDLSGNAITNNSLKFIAKFCNNLTSLNLSGCARITDDGIRLLAQHCPLLNYLDLRATGVSNALLINPG